jgi:hypothetical protein
LFQDTEQSDEPRFENPVFHPFSFFISRSLYFYKTYWAEQVLKPARPIDFHTVILKHNRTKRLCEQPCWVRLFFGNTLKPSEEKGEKLIKTLPPCYTLTPYSLLLSQILRF